jgi:hypothetical protein
MIGTLSSIDASKMMTTIAAAEALKAAPYNTYDSVLEKPNGNDPGQNAWLTLQLRIKLNFADSKNQVPGLTVNQGGKWFAKDNDGYLFPLLDWPAFLITRFQKSFVQVAEQTWNRQFILITPKTYADLDYQSLAGGGLTVRPNVLCLFRLSLLGPSGPLDSSPASGPLNSGPFHRTINVVNLTLSTRQVKLDPSVPATPTKPATKNLGTIDGLSWRSNANNYDDSDSFNPSWWNKDHGVLSNTVGHEVGHALGQCHIMGLKGDPKYQFGGANANDRAAYGEGSSDPLDEWNIMGGGDRVYLINAVSWRQRMALHTGLHVDKWDAIGTLNAPPRTLPMTLTGDLMPKEW